MLNEIVFAWRRSRRRRAFALFSVLTLAIGIAAVTVSYAVIEAALLRPPPIRDVGEVVNVYNADPFHGASGPGAILLSLPDIADLRRRQTVCSHLTAWARIRPTLTIESHSEPLLGEAVDAEYFETLKVNPAAGRLIAATDHAPGAPAVAVISEALWRSRFGGDHGIIGARMRPESCGNWRAGVTSC